MSAPDLRRQALDYAAHGWAVFPLRPGGKLPAIPAAHAHTDPDRASCRGACGRLGHGVHDATTDLRTVEHWWGFRPASNIGLACGPSRLYVIDLDIPKDTTGAPPEKWARVQVRNGADVFGILAEQHGEPIPDTLTVRTPSGGTHLYFTEPAGAELHNTKGRLGWLIDTRGRGGYVVAAGSLTKGRAYVASGDQVAPLPGWLVRLLSPAPAAPRVTPSKVSMAPRRHGDRLAPLLRHVMGAAPGNRNSALFWAACRAFEHADAGRVDPDDARAELLDAAAHIGLTPREARATLESAARRILGGAA